MSTVPPKLFISYSWTSSAHEEWVLSLATELVESGVNVVLDKWDLREGQDAYAFMEKMVTDPGIKKVIVVCDRLYAEKADGRSGGVGAETQIISPEIYAQQDLSKFVAVLPERDEDGTPFLPAYYKSRIYIDLSSPDLYSKNFEQLLRWTYDLPLHVKPELGKMPAFLTDEPTISLQTTAKFRRAVDAIRDNRPHQKGALAEYFETFAENLERFRLENDDEELDEKVVRNVEQFIPYRNEAVEVFTALARYRATTDSWYALHKFFESLMPYLDRPEHVKTWHDEDFDNFKFIVHELFLYAVATLIHSECFDGVAHLLRQYYYVVPNASRGQDAMVPFSNIYDHLHSLNRRNERLQLRRLSLHADMLKSRSSPHGLPFWQIMQADLVLFVRDCLDCLRSDRWQSWIPVTLVYAGRQYGPFELFAKSQSARYFEKVEPVFDIASKDDLMPLAEAFRERRIDLPRWGFDSFNPFHLMGFDKLGTLP